MTHCKGLLVAATAVVACLVWVPAAADPWAGTGDLALRHDLRLLADAGLITSPTNTWPIPWATIAADLDRTRSREPDDPAVAAARARMQQRISQVRAATGLRPTARLAARTDAFWTRTFEDTPRDEGEARVGVAWRGERFSARGQVSYAHDPLPDDREWRVDGSYLAGVFGNQLVSVGALDRWWGPGWNDTLILSSNARPVLGASLERNIAHAFETRWLAWLGPWRYTLFGGALGDNTEPQDAYLLGFRFDARPHESLEIGLVRTAQWCGDGRPCDGDSLWNLVVGRDNQGSSGIGEENEPGNQLAGGDFRWRLPTRVGPWAVYGQAIGEDEAGGLPAKFFGQIGLETWGAVNTALLAGNVRANLEYTNTTVRFLRGDSEYNVAYEHSVYRNGYRYERRALGAGLDGDSEVISLGVGLIDGEGRSFNGVLRFGAINQKGAGLGRDARHSVAPEELRIFGAQLSHQRALRINRHALGALSLGIGVQYADNAVTGATDTDTQVFVQWRWDYAD